MIEHLESRVGKVEREQARQGEQLDHLTKVVDKTATGVERLLDREARRSEPISLRLLAGIATGVIAIAIVGSWLIENSPALVDLRGRVTKIEWRLDNPASWTTTVKPR